MNHDWPFWMTLGGTTLDVCAGSMALAWTRVVACSIIMAFYCLIVLDWYEQQLRANDPTGLASLKDMRNIFIYCGLSGYGVVVVLTWIPFWSLTFVLYGLLLFHSGRYLFRIYVLRAGGLDVVYSIEARLAEEERAHRSQQTKSEMLSKIVNSDLLKHMTPEQLNQWRELNRDVMTLSTSSLAVK